MTIVRLCKGNKINRKGNNTVFWLMQDLKEHENILIHQKSCYKPVGGNLSYNGKEENESSFLCYNTIGG